MHTFEKSSYPERIAELIDDRRECALDAGTPNQEVARRLESLDLQQAFAPHPITDLPMARACHSGLWLLHQFLDDSHEISQRIDTPTGSFWHGIMHRLEGDYSNAKYWFRRVGVHPVFKSLAAAAQATCSEQFPNKIVWDPYDYIDRCEAAIHGPNHDVPVLRRIGRIEWELLFDFSCQQAVGAQDQ